VTKCNENQSKEETKNKAPKIINTGKYMINQPVNITYQEAQRINLFSNFVKSEFLALKGYYIVVVLTILLIFVFFQIVNYKVCYYTQ
jgi:hypothetical protein